MINPTQAAQTSVQSQATSGSKTSAIASDFETFLLMMTTQAQNQDPLDPMDSAEYASQLAQFSMVEQQVQTNDLLASLTSSMGSLNLGELANWVGMDVRSTSGFSFDSQPVTLFAAPHEAADQATLTVRDADGKVVSTSDVPPDQTEFTWAGTDSDGNPLPPGNYTATLSSYQDGEHLSETPVASYGRVVEAQIGTDSILLTLEGGQIVPTHQVSGVRSGA